MKKEEKSKWLIMILIMIIVLMGLYILVFTTNSNEEVQDNYYNKYVTCLNTSQHNYDGLVYCYSAWDNVTQQYYDLGQEYKELIYCYSQGLTICQPLLDAGGGERLYTFGGDV